MLLPGLFDRAAEKRLTRVNDALINPLPGYHRGRLTIGSGSLLMKYKDYYSILGVERDATMDAIKKAYRKLAHKYHPDISQDPQGEERFKEIAEAYQTLKDPTKRAAYDKLGRHQTGEDFRPPPEWGEQFGGGQFSFEDIDLSDLFASRGRGGLRGDRPGMSIPLPGQDFEVTAPVTLEDAYHGTELDLKLPVPEYDGRGRLRRVPRALRVRIPRGVTDGDRLRLPGKGGKGRDGGPNGNLYLNIALQPHPLYRVAGNDLYLDLPIAPWEAALGATVEVPTPGGPVNLKVPAGTSSGHKLRLGGRGLPKRREGAGDLYAIAQIVGPGEPGEREQALYRELGEISNFNPRSTFPGRAEQ
jgi:curved DNA-binding protein